MRQELALDYALKWEAEAPDVLYMTQPMGAGKLETFTWKRTLDEARKIATYLKSLDLPEKSHIAMVSKNTAWWIITDLAIWLAGHVSIPLYPTLTRDTVQQILEHSDAKLVFVGKLDDEAEIRAGIPEGLPKVAMPLSTMGKDDPQWADLLANHEAMHGGVERDPEECATIVYTSGSTGMPKGAMLSFGAMSTAAKGLHKQLPVFHDDRMLSYLPLAHVFERWIIETGSIVGRFQIFFAESIDTFVQDLQRARPTMFVSVPRLWQKFQLGVFAKMPPGKLATFLKIPILSGIVKKKVLTGLGLDQVRFAGSGSAPIPPDLIQWYRDLGLELLEGYGMTENFCYSHVSRIGRSRVGYVGEAYPGVDTRISDEGEIQIKSPGLMMGYYKEPDLTKDVFTADGFLKTGDRGEIDSQGRLRITGRVKELFKTSKGKYVAPAPIENKLQVHTAIEVVCVSGSGQPAPYALAALSDDARAKLGDSTEKSALQATLATHLAEVNETLDPHEKVAKIVVVKEPWLVENGFLTPTMKIRRAVIEERYGDRTDQWYGAKDSIVWE